MDQRPWLKNYPPGIPANIDHSKYETLVDFLNECFQKYKKKKKYLQNKSVEKSGETRSLKFVNKNAPNNIRNCVSLLKFIKNGVIR